MDLNHLRTNRRAMLAGGAGLAAASVLSGCGGADRGSPDAPDTRGPSVKLTQSTKPQELEGEVTIWDREGDLFKVFDNTIQQFMKEHPKVKVKHLSVDISAKLPKALLTGTNVPDGSFWEDNNIQGSAAHLTDLSDLVKPYEKDTIQFKLDVNTVNGRLVGVPWDLDPGLMYYRVDVLEKAGVDPESIETYDDLAKAAQQVKAKLPNTKPIRYEGDEALGQLWLEMFANQNGTSMVDEKGQLKLQEPAYLEILKWLDAQNKAGLATSEKILKPADLANLESGVNAFAPYAIWFDFAIQNVMKKSKGLWRATKLPAWKAGGARSGIMGGSSFVIPAKAKRPDLAWAVFEYMVYTEPGYTSVYGPNKIYPKGLNTSLPSYKPALDPAKPLFQPVEAMGNQDLWKVACEAADEVPGGYRIAPWYNQSVKYLGANLQKMFKGQLTPEQVISQSSDQITKNLINRR